jgi:hypothetical protein
LAVQIYLDAGTKVGDEVGEDLMDRGLIACTVTDAHDAAHRVPSSIWNEWGESLLKEELQ